MDFSSEDEFELPVRQRGQSLVIKIDLILPNQNFHNQSRQNISLIKRTLSGVITEVNDVNRVCLIDDQSIATFDELTLGIGQRKPKLGTLVDLIQVQYFQL